MKLEELRIILQTFFITIITTLEVGKVTLTPEYTNFESFMEIKEKFFMSLVKKIKI